MSLTRLLREEGFASTARRVCEYAGEAMQEVALLARRAGTRCEILNVTAFPLRSGFGGVGVQLRDRLAEEVKVRKVALLRPGILGGALEIYGEGACARRLPIHRAGAFRDVEFAQSLATALRLTGAAVAHVEGAAGVPWTSLLENIGDRRFVLSLHDFALWSPTTHLLEQEASSKDVAERREAAALLLARADAVVFSSSWLLEKHAERFALDPTRCSVIEPGIRPSSRKRVNAPGWKRIAFAGAFQEHKGAGILGEVIRATAALGVEWHLFGGGDTSSVAGANVRRHGFYRAHELPALLVREKIDLLLLPSIVPESFSLTVSQAWSAGVPVLAFDHGAVARRVKSFGGGWVADPARGASALAEEVRAWSAEKRTTLVPLAVPTAQESATAMLALYHTLARA